MKNTGRWIIMVIVVAALITISFLESARKPVAEISLFGKAPANAICPAYLKQFTEGEKNQRFNYFIYIEEGNLVDNKCLPPHPGKPIKVLGSDGTFTMYILSNELPDLSERCFKEVKMVPLRMHRILM